MDLLRPTVFFRPKTISNVAITKTNSAIIAFFLFSSFLPPRSFFFFFPFPSLLWFWSLSSPRNLPFHAFSLNWLQISVGWFSEKSAGYLSEWKTKCLSTAVASMRRTEALASVKFYQILSIFIFFYQTDNIRRFHTADFVQRTVCSPRL